MNERINDIDYLIWDLETSASATAGTFKRIGDSELYEKCLGICREIDSVRKRFEVKTESHRSQR